MKILADLLRARLGLTTLAQDTGVPGGAPIDLIPVNVLPPTGADDKKRPRVVLPALRFFRIYVGLVTHRR